ncbi:MAG: DUF1553 domain-containing protein, partial [Planctomycetota bacterium]
PPSHPRLLDFISRQLINDGWDLKRFCKRIVLSSTYRQSSVPKNRNLYESDPANVWLARGPKHRLSAEQVRDAALHASGLLVNKIGGPSVKPYQPKGLWRESGTGKTYTQSKGDGLYRRSLYTFWRRTAPPPSMLTFDATSRETCTARRELTTTPLQALVLLNDPQFVEAARVLAQIVMQQGGDDINQRWDIAFQRLIARTPTDAERTLLNDLYAAVKSEFESKPNDAKQFLEFGESKFDAALDPIDFASTATIINTLMNYDETMMKR